MNPQLHSLPELHHRLLKLERQNRSLKRIGAAALIIVVSALVMGQASLKRTVEADEFILKDNGGNVRARLSMNAALGSPEMLLLDETGKTRLKLTAGLKTGLSIGGGISIFDGQGREREVFSADDNGPFFSLLDAKGLPNTGLTDAGATAPGFTLEDAGRNIRARLFMTEKTTTKMTIPGTTESVPVTLSPLPVLALYNEKGKARVFMDGDGEVNTSILTVSDSQGQTLGSFSAITEYGAMLALDNGKGEQRLFMEPGHLQLSDDDGFQAGLGVEKNLVTPRTGETHKTSAASLLLFDRNKNVIWRAP